MNKKQIIYISLAILGAILFYIIQSTNPMITFSTVNFEGLTSTQCEARNNPCTESDGLTGQLLNCHVGSGNICYCEFRSYSPSKAEETCGKAEVVPVKTTTGTTITKTSTTPTPATTTEKTTNIFGTEIELGSITTLIGVILVSMIIVYFIRRRGY